MGVLKRSIKSKSGNSTDYWYIRYTFNGRDKWESVGKVGIITKAVAQARLEERKRQIRLGQLDMIGAEIPTLVEFEQEYLKYVRDIAQKRSWKRDVLSLRHLKGFLGEHKLSAISPKYIQDYQSKRLKDGVKPSTVNRELACLKHLYNVAKQRSMFFGDNPVSKVKFLEENNQKERVLTVEEEERLISNCAPHLKSIIFAPLSIIRVAAVCLRSWNLSPFIPAILQALLKEFFKESSLLYGVPLGVRKTYS